MKPISKKLNLKNQEYYKQHLNIVNAFLPVKLTPKELDVLALFMSFDGIIANERFGTTARKIVMDKLNLSSGGLGNYLKSLSNKKFIDTKSNQILPILMPDKEKQQYYFELNNTDHA